MCWHSHAVVSYMLNVLWHTVGRHRSTVNIHRHQTFIPLRVATVKHDPSNITANAKQIYEIYSGYREDYGNWECCGRMMLKLELD